jgi:hypothetical protein
MVKIEDVTTQILEGTATLQTKPTNRKKFKKTSLREPHLGKKTKLRFMRQSIPSFVTETFLMCVWLAPPTSIGKFGSDDNWVWPRHTGIFHYSEFMLTKQPSSKIFKRMCLILKTLLTYFADGVAEDDFTLVLVIQEKRVPTLSSHRTNCKRTQSCKN